MKQVYKENSKEFKCRIQFKIMFMEPLLYIRRSIDQQENTKMKDGWQLQYHRNTFNKELITLAKV